MNISERIASNALKMLNALSAGQDYYATLSNSALSLGTTYFQDGDYDHAISAFKQAIAKSPMSDNAVTAYELMAESYKELGKTDEEIKVLKQAISMFPQSDTFRLKLGNIYYGQGNYSAAETEYSMAVKLNPNVEENEYALGQAYLAQDKYAGAETQFKKVIRLASTDASGYYSLGQTYHKMGEYDAALEQFNKALSIESDYTDVYLEMGKTYVDMKESAKASETLTTLQSLDSTTAKQLQTYISEKTDPRFIAAYSINGFNTSLGPKSQVSSISSSLTDPNSSHVFSMKFTFSKDMDLGSVLNIANWSITKSDATSPGGPYNWGLLSSTDTTISPIPLSVSYNSETRTAEVQFRVSQNAEGNATIDTSHTIFKFSGVDAYGMTMSLSGDQYSGVSQIA
jgi:tetratricopeptide (TPR) repeat protein